MTTLWYAWFTDVERIRGGIQGDASRIPVCQDQDDVDLDEVKCDLAEDNCENIFSNEIFRISDRISVECCSLLMTSHLRFRWWLGVYSVPSHLLNQCWFWSLVHYVSRGFEIMSPRQPLMTLLSGWPLYKSSHGNPVVDWYRNLPGPRLNIKTFFRGMGISMLKIRLSQDLVIFNTGIPILVRRHLYIEMPPWFSNGLQWLNKEERIPGTLILTWINFNPSMDK